MKIKFLTNIPSPYRLDFFNELGKNLDLEVIFEAERNNEINEAWYTDRIETFKATFLKKGAIEEKKINWKIFKNIKKDQQDLIIVTNYAYFTELVGLIYIKLKKIPYCLEIDGGIIKQESLILKKIKTFLIKGANGYISPSASTDKFLMNYGVKKQDIFRYNFTSLRESEILKEVISQNEKNILKKKWGVENKKIILGIGRFIKIKGFDILLKSAVEFKEDIQVILVGGQATQEYKKICEEYNLKNITFIDFKSKEELSDLYKLADVFVLPTRGDVWGLVINEAMAHGLPVITTDKCVAGLELVEQNKNGFIIGNDDKKELINKIKFILNDNEKKICMGKRSLDVINDFTIEKMVGVHLNIFNEILK